MAANMSELTADLAAETVALRDLVADLDEAGWHLPTPAPGWSIADQISHLAYFDDVAVLSATDPETYEAELAPPFLSGEVTPDDIAERYRSLTGAELLAWFDDSRRNLIETYAELDPGHRMSWFGLPMGAATSLTARIMETWAHGQDIADALGRTREPTGRLRHVAHIGVRTLSFSFLASGREVPADPVRVELTGPDGEPWTWGPAGAANQVSGPAEDFCLLVTQRRHRADTALQATGPVAEQWLDTAQAFAGAPGAGRQPGQFPGR